MNCGDDDMMEADGSASPPTLSSTSGPNDVGNLLAMAHQLIREGKPSQALQAVVMAMKIQGGDEAVAQALGRAREQYVNKIRDSAAADKLASLFAECAIAEAVPSQAGLSQHKMSYESCEPNPEGKSILAESGRKQIVLDAFSDGSSFVCLQCGGLVSNHRRDEHFAFWCCKI